MIHLSTNYYYIYSGQFWDSLLAERGSESGSNVFSSDRNLVRNQGQSKATAIPLMGKLLDVPILSHEQTFKTFYLTGFITFVLILTILVQNSPWNLNFLFEWSYHFCLDSHYCSTKLSLQQDNHQRQRSRFPPKCEATCLIRRIRLSPSTSV